MPTVRENSRHRFYYLPYDKSRWFKTTSVNDVFDVQMKG